MRRLVAIMVVAMLASSTALAAGAKGPTDRGGQKEPLAGTTCEERYGSGFENEPFLTATGGGEALVFTLEGRSDYVCVDVSDVGPGDWSVYFTPEPEGSLRDLSVVLRDSVAPGDACAVSDRRAFLSPITLPGVPGDYANVCGIEWAEIVDGVTYYDIRTDVTSPLVLQVSTRGSNDLKVDFRVVIPAK